jgi:hypothetical protein
MDETKNSKPQPVAWQVMSGDQSEREFSIKDMAYDYVREQNKSGYRISLWIRPLYAERVDDIFKQALAEHGQEQVKHCEAGPDYCPQCHCEDQFENRSLALASAVRYVKNNTPKLVFDEIYTALKTCQQHHRKAKNDQPKT